MLKRISILFFLGTTLSHLGAMNLAGDSYLERTIAGDAYRVELELLVAEYRDLLCSLDRRIEEIEEEETRAGLVADRPMLVAAYQQAEEDLRQHTTITSLPAPALSKEDPVKKSLLVQIAMVNRRCKELSKAL